MQKRIIAVLCVCLLASCASTGIQNNESRATETREHLDSLRGAQSESAAASASLDEQLKTAGEQSAALAAEITGSTDDIEKIERSITDGTDNIAELKRIIDCIRKRGGASTDRTE